MKLYLMRHGQAESPQIDPLQGLTSAGREAVKHIAQQCVSRGACFEQAFHSEKERARQTAEIMTGIIAPAVVPQLLTGLKPNDDPHLLLSEVNRWQQDTLITSHLPLIPGLLALLCAGSQRPVFEPASVVCLSKAEGKWNIEWFMSA